MLLETSRVPAPAAGGMGENLFWKQMWAKVNGKGVNSDAGSA